MEETGATAAEKEMPETVEEPVAEEVSEPELPEEPDVSIDIMEVETTEKPASEEEIAEAGEQMETYAANNIASGKDGNITWVIDANGKLTVEGTGDLSGNRETWWEWGYDDFAWRPYILQITSAKINVSGMTDASYLFNGCRNMTGLDISNFDISSLTNTRAMFMCPA